MTARMKNITNHLTKYLGDLKSSGKLRVEVPQQATLDSRATLNNKSYISFATSNYLSLGTHPKIIDAVGKNIQQFGWGSGSARSISGTSVMHKEVEARISKFFHTEDSITYNSCFDANTGFFETLFGAEDAIFSDKLNHASIIDGIRLCKAKRFLYEHSDMVQLEEMLKSAGDRRFKVICTDGTFSMDGDYCKLPELIELADRYNAMLFVDDCHGFGTIGKGGRGVIEHYDCLGKVDVITSTFGKAMSGMSGGFLASSNEVVTLLRQMSRTYIFSNNISSPQCAAILACFDILEETPEIIQNVQENSKYLKTKLRDLGFEVWGDDKCCIAAVLLYDELKTIEFQNEL